MELISKRIQTLQDELFEMGEVLSLQKCIYPKQKSPDTIQSVLPDNLIEFYKEIDSFELKWVADNIKDSDSPIFGSVRILKPSDVLADLRGIVYSKDEDEDYCELETFKIVDYYADEACVGYKQDERRMDYMEYLDIGEPSSEALGLDFNGYLEMMLAAKGFNTWQRVILNLSNGSGYTHKVEEFKTYMPQLFPDFKWEDFVALYERVRIK